MRYQVQVKNPDTGVWTDRFADLYVNKASAQVQVRKLTKGYRGLIAFRVTPVSLYKPLL